MYIYKYVYIYIYMHGCMPTDKIGFIPIPGVNGVRRVGGGGVGTI
jgi:hypothetical protein